MALDASALATAIRDELDTEFPAGDRDIDTANRRKFAEALAAAIVTRLTSDAVVTGRCPPNGGPLTSGRLT